MWEQIDNDLPPHSEQYYKKTGKPVTLEHDYEVFQQNRRSKPDKVCTFHLLLFPPLDPCYCVLVATEVPRRLKDRC